MGCTHVMKDLKSKEGCLGLSGGSNKIIGTLKESSPSEEGGGRRRERKGQRKGRNMLFSVLEHGGEAASQGRREASGSWRRQETGVSSRHFRRRPACDILPSVLRHPFPDSLCMCRNQRHLGSLLRDRVSHYPGLTDNLD